MFLHLLYGDYNTIKKKIEQLSNYLTEPIKKYLSNNVIFNIFVKNKRILLFLIEEKIIILNTRIVKKFIGYKFSNKDYDKYFLPEIRPFKRMELK